MHSRNTGTEFKPITGLSRGMANATTTEPKRFVTKYLLGVTFDVG